MDWDDATAKLLELFPEAAERGRIRAKLLDLEPGRRIEYFNDPDDAAVKASLLTFLGECTACQINGFELKVYRRWETFDHSLHFA